MIESWGLWHLIQKTFLQVVTVPLFNVCVSYFLICPEIFNFQFFSKKFKNLVFAVKKKKEGKTGRIKKKGSCHDQIHTLMFNLRPKIK